MKIEAASRLEMGIMMNKELELASRAIMHTYNRNVVFDRGEDVYLYDSEGRKYLDFAAGIAVSALGYSNEAYKTALKNQVDKLIHISNLYYNEPSIAAAQKFVKASGMDRVFFTNSGTEAIEGALKLARKYAYLKNKDSRGEIIAMEHSFHGRSMGALSVTGTKKYREAFEPLIGGVSFGVYNDLESVRRLVTKDTCAIILEAVQGEGGIYPATEEFMKGIRALCDEHDIVMICDEIQCGMGRTGKMFAYQNYQVLPDVIASAKALGCGVPVGAIGAVEAVAKAFVPGDHGTTYGGNPLATAAVSTVFDIFEEEQMINRVNSRAAYLEERLDALVEKYDFLTERRGMGLMQGLECTLPVGDIVEGCMKKGLVIITAGSNVLRFVPPLVITDGHIDEMIAVLDSVLEEQAGRN